MLPKATDGDRLLLLTFMLEAAVAADDWTDITEIIRARAALIGTLNELSKELIEEIGEVEERVLTVLRRKLVGTRADIRNLSAALRIAAPYVRAQRASTLSLAG